MKEIRKKLTYANVMSSLAVFLVLGGATAVAAGHLGKNSVGTKQLKSGAVTAKKIRSQAVTGTKIQDGSVTGSDIGSEAVTGTKIQDGTVTGSDIAKNSITGAQIDAGSLPEVPVADRTAGEFTMTLPFQTADRVPVEVPAPFEVFASCSDSLGADRVQLVLASRAPGTTFSDEGGDVPPQEFVKILLVGIDLPEPHDGHPTTVKSHEGPVIAMSPDGVVTAIEDVTVSINVGSGRDCGVSGTIRQLS